MAGVKGVKDARFDLIPPEAAWLEALVYGMGASKYAERNWEQGYEWGKSIAALKRHIALFEARESFDEESLLPHMAHARWHTGALIAFEARRIGIDDRAIGVNLDLLQAKLLNADEIKSAKDGILPLDTHAILTDPAKVAHEFYGSGD